MTSFAADTLDISRINVGDIIPALDFEETRTRFVAAFLRYVDEERAADPDLPAYDVANLATDPIMRVARAGSFVRLFERAVYDDRIRNLLLGSAKGAALDLIGTTYYGVQRMITPAVPTLSKPELRESDERYLRRLQLAPEAGLPRAQRRGVKLGAAKTLGGYVFHALSCDLRVREADSECPERGCIDVAVLAEDGEDPDVVTASVRDWLMKRDVKGGTDILTVRSADIVVVDVAATLYAPYGPDGGALTKSGEAAFRKFIAGRNLFRAPLYGEAIDASLLVYGIENVVRQAPAGDTLAPFGTVIRPGNVALSVQRIGSPYA